MLTDGTPSLPRLNPDDLRVAGLHAQLHASRLALVRAILHDPDGVEDREPLWIEFFALKRAVANTIERVADALAAIDEPNDLNGVSYPVTRADGSWSPVASHVLYPYLGEAEPDSRQVSPPAATDAAARRQALAS
jgi:hypothetical protein